MVISKATARTHVSHAVVKLSARDRTQPVVVAYQTGLVGPARLPRRADHARPPRPASVDRDGPVAAAGGALQARPGGRPGGVQAAAAQ